MSPLPVRRAAPRQILTRILDHPDLVAAVQALPARALGKLIEHVGLEDSGEIVALATTEQLRRIFDDDLWRSERPGKDEQFDAGRFALWLEVMLEAGEAFAAQKLAELPEDLVTLALHKNVLVINIEELAVAMSARDSDDDGLTEKALESCLCEEIDEYRIISRHHEGWDAILAVLLALDRDHHEFLGRVLDHCCHMAAEYIDDNGGLYQVLTSDEMLESDLGADREERRAEEGFIAPSSAASFLALARTTELTEIVDSKGRDPVTRAYFRSLGVPSRAESAHDGAIERAAASAADAATLVEVLRDAEVLPPAWPMHLLEGPADASCSRDSGVFVLAMHELRAGAPDLHDQRMEELAYLANVLAAGCAIEGRALRPLESAHLAVAVCNLGIEHMLRDEPARAPATTVLHHQGADKLFRIGWRLLVQEVVLPAASIVEKLLVRATLGQSDRELLRRLEQASRALRSAIAAGKPWTALRKLDALADHLDADTSTTLLALLDETPSLRGKLASLVAVSQGVTDREVQFISTRQQIRSIQAFLADL